MAFGEQSLSCGQGAETQQHSKTTQHSSRTQTATHVQFSVAFQDHPLVSVVLVVVVTCVAV